jgi:hypothetical protein
MAFTIFSSVDFLWSMLVPQEPGTELHVGGRNVYDRVLFCALNG